MDGEVETIWALLKGETGEGCKAARILSEEEEEIRLGTFVVFVGTPEGVEREDG